MKILWLYKYLSQYNFDHFLHMDIAEAMNKIEGIEVRCYGPNLYLSNKDLNLCHYNPSYDIEYLYKIFKFDVIICCTKSRMFMDYLPPEAMGNEKGEIRKGEWIPQGMRDFNLAKKVVFEEDYHYETDDAWYKSVGIDAILQRHYSNVNKGIERGKYNIPHIFFPFSVDTNVFRDKQLERINKISFAGSVNLKYYADRVLAINALRQHGLLAYNDGLIHDKDYIDNLNTYTIHLSSHSRYSILPAKTFEITSSGSVLFTNYNDKSGLEKVFNDTSYLKWEENKKDIVEKALWILTHEKERKKIVESALEDVKTRHSHQIRAKEFIKIIEGL